MMRYCFNFKRSYDLETIHEYLVYLVKIQHQPRSGDVSALLLSRDSAISILPPSRFRVKYKLIPLQVDPLPFSQGITSQYVV
jgi:hypothetical protein